MITEAYFAAAMKPELLESSADEAAGGSMPHAAWQYLGDVNDQDASGQQRGRQQPSEREMMIGTAATPAVAIAGPTNPADWSTQQLCGWLETMDLGDVVAATNSEQVDGAIAVAMDNDAWKELGVGALKAAKVMAGLRKLRLKPGVVAAD